MRSMKQMRRIVAKARKRWLREYRNMPEGVDETPKEIALWERFNELAKAYVVARGLPESAHMVWDCPDSCFYECGELFKDDV